MAQAVYHIIKEDSSAIQKRSHSQEQLVHRTSGRLAITAQLLPK